MAIDLTIEGKTARIVLNRPEVGNALDTHSCRALLDAVHRCEADPAIRVVILTGAGRMFCAGGDVAGFSSAGSDLPRLLRDLTAPLHMAVARLARMPKPVITAVNGAAAGAGLSLALIGDIVLASDAASFSVAYPGVGLSPDGGATFLLPKLMGLRRAQAFILLNRKLSAAEALDQGLATFVCPSADLAAETQAMAERLSAAPTLAIGRSRMLLADSFAAALESQLEAEARAISACGGEPDALEGIAAFVGRRAPVFDRD